MFSFQDHPSLNALCEVIVGEIYLIQLSRPWSVSTMFSSYLYNTFVLHLHLLRYAPLIGMIMPLALYRLRCILIKIQ